MAAAILARALKEFEAALDDLSGNFEFVRVASRLRPRLGGMLNWGAMDGDAAALAKRFMGQRNGEEALLYRGMVVSLSGAFEEFVRRVLRDGISAINEAGMSYAALEEEIKRENIYRTGLAFQTIHEPLDYLDLNYESLSENMGTCLTASEKAILNAEAFTLFVSIVSPDSLAKSLRRIGVDLRWDELGKVPAVQSVFEKGKTRETAKEIQSFLRKFGQTRNKIAHTGSSGIVISEPDLEQLLAFFRTFAGALASVVETELAKRFKK